MAKRKKKKTPAPEGIDALIERDLTALAAAGELEPAFEVDEPLDVLAQILRSAQAAPPDYRRFPLIVGERGVGKSALIRELVRRGHPALDDHRIVTLDVHAILQGADSHKELLARVAKVITALHDAAEDTIAVIQGISALQVYGVRDFHNLLNDPEFLLIVEAEPAEYRKVVEEAPELARRFLPVSLDEPAHPTLVSLLTQWSEHKHDVLGVQVSEDAIEMAIELTDRFLPAHRQPRKSIDLLSAAASGTKSHTLTKATVVDWFATIHAVPRFLVNPDEPLDLEETETFFRERLIGQEEAIKAVLRVIATIKAGVGDVHRPLGTFLFVGPTGVGKTHIAQLLAEYLFGSRHAMLRFNMTDYADPHDSSILFGNPWADTMADKQGVLSQRLVARPFGVLLLDELEKAHPLVLDRLFQLIDEGRYQNAAGEMVYTTTVVIIATSNAGSEVFRERSIGFLEPGDEPELVRNMMREIDNYFRFEFLNRFDKIVAFRPLRRGEIRELGRRELSGLLERTGIKRRRLQVEVSESVLDLLATVGYDPLYGARFLRREIERRVVGPMAETLVRQNPPVGSRLTVGVRGDRITIRVDHAGKGAQPVAVRNPAGEKVERLDASALDQRAEELLALRREAEERLASDRIEAARLLEATRNEDFWNDPPQARATLEAYRTADLLVQAGKRLVQALDRLGEVRSDQAATTKKIARAVEWAANSLERWRDLTVEGGGPVWILIGPADALQTDGDLIRRLTKAYLRWARRCGFDADVVAEELDKQGKLLRTAILADAPNAHAVFAMERGVHRLVSRKNGKQKSHRSLVDVLPVTEEESEDAGRTTISDARHAAGKIVPQVTARALIEVFDRGLEMELLGSSRTLLEALSRAILSNPAPDHETARIYGEGGTGARDPRTGAVSARIKDVWSGDLSRFLSAWRDAPPA